MISKTIGEIASMIEGQLILNNASLEDRVKGVCIDSRVVQEHSLYIPIIGERVDGHTFISDVEASGASLTLCSDKKYLPKHMPAILVKDCLVALQELAKNYRNSLSTTVIAITGSNGKTSCKDILAGCLSAKYKTQKTLGNHNNEIGVPLTLLSLDEDCEMAVIEMGMENREEIHFLNTLVNQDFAIVTNVGIAHLENLGSMENIAHAKLEIADSLHEHGLFIYYGDDEYLSVIMKDKYIKEEVKVETFGKNKKHTLYLTSLKQDENGIYFQTNKSDFIFHIDILGEHQALNSLAALLIAYHLGMNEEEMQDGFNKMEKTKMRNELKYIKKCTILDDSYKSNPQSAMAAIETFAMFDSPYKMIVLADMLDLGPTTKTLHYDLGNSLKKFNFDEIICMGELSRYIAEGAKAANCGGTIKMFDNHDSISEYLKSYLDQECMILFKGSRGMALDKVVSQLKEYGDNDE